MSQTKAQLIDNLVQPITGAAGSASAPTFSFTSDPNTGLYSPGADQLALSTGGTQRLLIDSSGNVGISAAVAAGARLNVLADSTGTGTANTRLFLTGYEGTSGNAAGLWFGARNDQNTGVIGSRTATGNIAFETYNGTWGERLRLTYDGKLGVGSSSPRGKLEVSDGTTNTAGEAINEVYIVGATTGSSEGILTIQSNDAMASDKGGSIAFGGRAVASSAAGANWAFINGCKEDGTTANYGGYLSFATRPNSGSISERMRIDSSGRVGIGTAVPSNTLDVRGSTEAGIRWGTTANFYGTLYADASLTSLNSYNSNPLAFSVSTGTGFSEKARIDSSGRLLVGTSSVGAGDSQYAKLQVVGNSLNNEGFFRIARNTATGSMAADDVIARMFFTDSSGGRYGQIDCFCDGTAGTNDYPGRLVFSTTADGASSPTEQFRVHSTGTVSFGTTNELPADNNVSGASIYRRQGLGQFSRPGVALTLNNTGGDGDVALFKRLGTTVGSIAVSSGATAYNTSSDYRLKENVIPLTGAADRVNQLKVYRFNFITDPDTTVDGFIAHEAQAVIPECVTGTKDEVDGDGNPVYQGIDQSKLVPLLTAALQEAIGRIETLEGMVAVNNITIDEMQGQLTGINTRLTALENA